jgi:hypothetical protein
MTIKHNGAWDAPYGKFINSRIRLNPGALVSAHVFPSVLAVHNNSLIAPSTCSTEMPVRHSDILLLPQPSCPQGRQE